MSGTRGNLISTMRPGAGPTGGKVTADELAAAFDHAPVGMAITGERATLLRANAALAAMLGYTPEELVGKSVVDLTHPEDLSDSLSGNDRLGRDEIVQFCLEKRYIHKSGHAVWARVFVSTLKKQPRRHLLHVVDITDEKRSFDRLRDTEIRFHDMAEAIEQDFWIINLTPFELLYSSPAAKRIWGFDPMSFRDRPDHILRYLHPDDLDGYSKLLDPNDPVPGEVEYRIIRDDGTLRWLRTRAFPMFDAAGQFYRVTGVTEDITSRKAAQLEVDRHREFERFIMELCTAFVNLPPEQVEKTFERSLGQLAAMIGADRAEIFVLDDARDVLTIQYSWSREGVAETPAYTEFSFAADNPLRVALVRDGLLHVDDVEALPDDLAAVRRRLMANGIGSFVDLPLVRQGKLVGIYGFATIGRTVSWPPDVAARLAVAAEVFSNAIERARMEGQVRQHRDALAHALRVGTMGQLASGIAHELNQPLAAILNYASACERRVAAGGADLDSMLAIMRKMGDQAMRAAEVIKRLRMLVRKGKGKRTWQDLHELVRSAIHLVESDLVDPDISLLVEQDADLPEVQVDPIQIEQVILNLIRNAVDAVRARSGDTNREIRIATRLQPPETIELRVSDNGPGMDARQVDHLFDEFFTTKEQGLGLGLSISRSIIEAHGGTLWLGDTSPAGTTFCFTLPKSSQ